MRVLLIDDTEQDRRQLREALVQIGFETITEAADGDEALLRLPQVRPDLIITDCQMSRMDGFRLTRALRAGGISVPIIMTSGLTDPAIVNAAIRAGVSGFVGKPPQVQELASVLRQTLGKLPQAA